MSIRARRVKMSVTVKGERYYFRPTGCSQAHWRKIRKERRRRDYTMTITRVAMPNAQGEFDPADIAIADEVRQTIEAVCRRT